MLFVYTVRDSDIDHRGIFILHIILVINPQLLFELICYKGLVLLQTSLDVHLELDNIVEHAHGFCVKLLAKRVGSERELLIPICPLVRMLDLYRQESQKTYSMLVFISLCSISCTDSESCARILASSFSIFSIWASEAIFWAFVT